ncbi:MAG: NUDIX hydrolase [Clostridia bacterium]|nr:NUDIX hydrolase [Clostridia bacterium]
MENNTNWGQSVAGVVVKEGKVLLARHTYGGGAGMLIIPGGFVEFGESPQDALKREFLEETGISVEPRRIIGVRFNMHDWYIVFEAEYVSGEAISDNNENSEVVWVDIEEAINRNDVPELTKTLLKHMSMSDGGLLYTHYDGKGKNAPYSLWCM